MAEDNVMIEEGIEDLVEATVNELEKSFFSDKFYFSYSSLNKLRWNPAVFYQMYILGIKEERTESHLINGKLIHSFILEPDLISEHYVVSPNNLPTGNLKVLIDNVYNKSRVLTNGSDSLDSYKQLVLDQMKEMDYYQNLTTDDSRLNKVLLPIAYNYWEFLESKKGKTLIDQETFSYCKSAADMVIKNPSVCSALACDKSEFDNINVWNELEFKIDYTLKDGYNLGFKGFIDNLVIDHDKKKITINDIKTTQKDLKDFSETVEFYSYWLQAAIYFRAIVSTYQDLNYNVEFNFIVIDRSFMSYVFKVSHGTIVNWLSRLDAEYDRIKWHMTNKSFNLPYEFATESIML